MPEPIWSHRLLVVIGKGGVGRSTCAAALGLAAAQSGKRVCVVEMDGLSDISRIFGYNEPTYTPRTVAPGLDIRSISAAGCLDDFVRRKLRLGMLSKRFVRSRALGAFLEAVPGLDDLLQLGKVENAMNEPLAGEPVYDLTILDAPATGHGLGMLTAARTMRRMTRVGPFAELARIIEVWLSDTSETAFVLVTLAEELPINECVDFLGQLGEDQKHLGAIVFNRMRRSPVPDSPAWPEAKAAILSQDRLLFEGVTDLIDRAISQAARQKTHTERLRETVAERFGLRPRMAKAVEETDGINAIAAALASLGEAL
jgi:anion-transporting  ArsA/GET3 family ATPase